MDLSSIYTAATQVAGPWALAAFLGTALAGIAKAKLSQRGVEISAIINSLKGNPVDPKVLQVALTKWDELGALPQKDRLAALNERAQKTAQIGAVLNPVLILLGFIAFLLFFAYILGIILGKPHEAKIDPGPGPIRKEVKGTKFDVLVTQAGDLVEGAKVYHARFVGGAQSGPDVFDGTYAPLKEMLVVGPFQQGQYGFWAVTPAGVKSPTTMETIVDDTNKNQKLEIEIN